MTPLSQIFARNVRLRRTQAGLTQAALAASAGVVVESIARIERCLRGGRSAAANPSLETMSAIADALGATVPEMLQGGRRGGKGEEASARRTLARVRRLVG